MAPLWLSLSEHTPVMLLEPHRVQKSSYSCNCLLTSSWSTLPVAIFCLIGEMTDSTASCHFVLNISEQRRHHECSRWFLYQKFICWPEYLRLAFETFSLIAYARLRSQESLLSARVLWVSFTKLNFQWFQKNNILTHTISSGFKRQAPILHMEELT